MAVRTSDALDIRTAARRLITEVRDGGDLSVLDEILTGDFVDHSLPPGFPPNADGLRALIPQLTASMPDGCHVIDLELVDSILTPLGLLEPQGPVPPRS